MSQREPSMKPVELDSYHEGPNGEIVNHDRGTLKRNPPRRFVFSWREKDERWALAVDEKEGTFSGVLEYDGHDAGPVVVSGGQNADGEWKLDVSWMDQSTGQSHVWTIIATEKPRDEEAPQARVIHGR